jgi:hypothetical protein
LLGPALDETELDEALLAVELDTTAEEAVALAEGAGFKTELPVERNEMPPICIILYPFAERPIPFLRQIRSSLYVDRVSARPYGTPDGAWNRLLSRQDLI